MAQARIAAIAGLLAWAGTAAAAPIPLSPEFQVNSFTLGDQGYPVVCRFNSGSFVAAWESYLSDGDSRGIAARRFDSSGEPVGTEFLVNTFTIGGQQLPDIACGEDSGFVVVWESLAQDGDSYGVFTRRYDSAGEAAGGEIQVNSYTAERQLSASACVEPGGGFVITWHSYEQDGYSYGVFGQRFDGNGARTGGEFQINAHTPGTQEFPSVACDPQGGFAVVWHSDLQDGDTYGVFGRRFASDGSALSSEFQVNSYTYYSQQLPDIDIGANGSFVVVWESYGYQDGDSYGVFGRRFSSDGAAQGTEFQVNTYTPFSQEAPQVAVSPDGAFTVAWSSSHDGDGYGVFGQQFSSEGARSGGEFQVNTFTLGYQGAFTALGTVLSLDSDQEGNFVVVWQSVDLFDVSQDGDGFGVFARSFEAGVAPTECAGDIDGNGVVSLAELVDGVQIALGHTGVGGLDAFDRNGDGAVSVVELLDAVSASMGECAA
jgi:hypothetical protein